MKRFMAAASLLALSVAHAEEVKFGDLNYLNKQGQFSLSIDANTEVSDYKVARDGAATIQYETEGYVLSTVMTYGLADRLNLLAGFDYRNSYETTNESAGNTKYDESGLTAPSLGLVYRLLSQGSDAFNFDIGVLARLAIQDAERGEAMGGDSADGNAALDRHSIEASARLGKKWNEANEWQLAAGIVYHVSGEYEQKDGGAGLGNNGDVEVDSSQDFFIRAAYQYRPVNEFMMTLSLQATRVGAVDSEDTDNKVDYNNDAHTDLDFGFVAKYLITSNFIAKFNYAQGINNDFDIKYANTDMEIKARRERSFGLGVEWLF